MSIKKISLLVLIFLFSNFELFSQEKELEVFRNKIYTFIEDDMYNKDNAKANQLQRDKLMKELEESFLAFVLQKNSHDFKTIKRNTASIGKGVRSIEIRRDYSINTNENNSDILVSFNGIYDYDGQQSVSFYIQPFRIDNKDYIVYYYKLNGKGKYYIKNLKNNKLLLESEAFSSEKAIANIFKIDENHLLIIEYMNSKGQRACVLKMSKNKLEQTLSFVGKTFIKNTINFTKSTNLIYEPRRKYLHLAGNENIIDHSNLYKKFILYDKENQTISYAINHNGQQYSAKWINNTFEIDDFYLGNYLNDKPMPFPDTIRSNE